MTGNIRIWDCSTKQLLNSFVAHAMPNARGGYFPSISGLQFHPTDNEKIYSTGLDGKIALWSHDKQESLAVVNLQEGQQATGLALELNNKNETLIVSTQDGFIIRFNPETLEEVARNQICKERINSISVSKSGVIAVACNKKCFLCNADLQIKLSTELDSESLLSIEFSPDEKQVATGGQNGKVFLLNTNTLEISKEFLAHVGGKHASDNTQKVRCIRWNSDGQLYTCGSDGSIKIWNSDFKLAKTLNGHGPNVHGRDDVLAVSINGTECYSIGRDHTLRVWDVEKSKCTFNLDGSLFPHQVFHSTDFARSDYCAKTNQLLVASQAYDAYARLWDLQNFTVQSNYARFPHTNEDSEALTQDVALNSDGTRFVVAEPNGYLTLWETGKKEHTKSVRGHKLKPYVINPRLPLVRVFWSRKNNEQFYSIGQDHKLIQWNSITLDKVKEVELTDTVESIIPESVKVLSGVEKAEAISRVKSANFDHQLAQYGTGVLTAGRDNFIRYWNLGNNSIEWRIDVPSKITAMEMDRGEKFLVVGTESGELYHVQLESKRIKSIDTYYKGFDQFAFAKSETFKVDKRYGSKLQSKWNQAIRSIAISNDGRFFAATNGHGALSFYELESGLLSRAFAYDDIAGSMHHLEVYFTSDSRLITIGADQAIREWDIHNMRQEAFGKEGTHTLRLIADPDIDRLLQIGVPENQDDIIWTNSNGKWMPSQLPEELKDITDGAFIPGQNKLLMGHLNGQVSLLDIESGQTTQPLKVPDGKREYDKPVGAFLSGSLVSVSYRGTYAASTWSEGDQHKIEIWDLKTGEYISSIKAYRGIEALAFHPKDNQFAFTDQLGTCRAFDLLAPDEPKELFISKGPQFATGLAYSPDGTRIIQSGQYYNNRILAIWNSQTGEEINPTSGEPMKKDNVGRNKQQDLFNAEYVNDLNGNSIVSYPDVAISPDGKWFATAGLDGYLVLWENVGPCTNFKSKISTSSLVQLLGGYKSGANQTSASLTPQMIRQVLFSRDSKTIYYVSSSGPVCVAKVDDLIKLSELTPAESLEKITRITGLRLDEFGRAETIEKNHLVPVKQD